MEALEKRISELEAENETLKSKILEIEVNQAAAEIIASGKIPASNADKLKDLLTENAAFTKKVLALTPALPAMPTAEQIRQGILNQQLTK